MFEEFRQKFKALSFTRYKQQAFLEDINSLIEDGVPAPQAIAAIEKTAEGVTREVALSIANAFASGGKLADGMEMWFPQPIIAIVRSGEESGTLTTTLKSAVQSLAESGSIVASLLSSLIYPIVVLILACVVAVFLKHSIFSNFLTIKPIQFWPENGKMFMVFATFVERWWWVAILVIALAIFLIFQMMQRLKGDVRNFLDSFPPFNIYRMVVSARFMEILGLLISNGVTFKASLDILYEKSTPYLMWHIYMMQLLLSSGRDNIAEVLDTGLIGREDMSRLLVIAQGKGLEHALVRLGIRSTKKSSKKMELTGKILGGILLAMDAGLAIFMILAVYSVGITLAGGGL